MDENKKFYLKFLLILAVVFFIWVSGSKKNIFSETAAKKSLAENKPAALVNFSPSVPTISIVPKILYQDAIGRCHILSFRRKRLWQLKPMAAEFITTKT